MHTKKKDSVSASCVIKSSDFTVPWLGIVNMSIDVAKILLAHSLLSGYLWATLTKWVFAIAQRPCDCFPRVLFVSCFTDKLISSCVCVKQCKHSQVINLSVKFQLTTSHLFYWHFFLKISLSSSCEKMKLRMNVSISEQRLFCIFLVLLLELKPSWSMWLKVFLGVWFVP